MAVSRPDASGIADIHVHDFGLAPYEAVWDLQKELVNLRLAGETEDVLLLGEHEPVITTGRGTHSDNIVAPGVPVIDIERGGDVTYHGPGQLIAYPIMALNEDSRDLHQYLRLLEEAVMATLAEFGVKSFRREGYTGVWVRDPRAGFINPEHQRKICSIGVAVKRWVTYHGIALNVNTDLSAFGQINPCGLDSNVMTTLADMMDEPAVEMPIVKAAFARHFGQVFGRKTVSAQPSFS